MSHHLPTILEPHLLKKEKKEKKSLNTQLPKAYVRNRGSSIPNYLLQRDLGRNQVNRFLP